MQIYLHCRGVGRGVNRICAEGKTYAEAESNANLFALACFVRRSREDLASRIGWASIVCTGGKCYGFAAN